MDQLVLAAYQVADLGPRAHLMVAIPVPFLTVAWVIFVFRVYVRAYMLRAFGKDDWAMALTLCIYTTSVALMLRIYAIETGGWPQEAVEAGPLAQITMLNELMKYIITGMGTYILSTVTLKISLCIFFLRVVFEPWQRKIIYVVTSIYSLFGTAWAFIAVFQCGNPQNFLIKEYTDQCLDGSVMMPLNYVHGSLNAGSDWIFAVLPVAVLWNSSLPRSAKISAGFLLSLGALGSISSLIRMKYIPGLHTGPQFFTNAVDIGVWSIIEPGLGIIAASLATLRPLFRSMMERTGVRSNEYSENMTDGSYQSSNRKSFPVPLKFMGKRCSHVRPARPSGGFARVNSDGVKSPMGVQNLEPVEEQLHAPQFNTTAPLPLETWSSDGYEAECVLRTNAINTTAPLPNKKSNAVETVTPLPTHDETRQLPDDNHARHMLVPRTAGSTQNRHWFPDANDDQDEEDGVMSRQSSVYDEEAGQTR